ncbi:UNVERIFIED_CONTAM: hypothetical protein Sradi_6792700 [Sesamum radiatum]|uniref:Myb-like domain-containing protein n=1 Tax=Sesamum radiatum TaxID=300843 RepID=A0AAW2JRY3_SESRA
MDEPRGSHRTRSKAAPDWTVEESLVLVNEINAVESEWGATLPSFQKWQQIVENCNALDVNRNLNQCKRKWDALLVEYRRVKHDAAADGSFPFELFKAIDSCVSARVKRNVGGGVEAEEDEDEDEDEDEEATAAEEQEEQVVMETDPDSDPEAQGRVTKFFFETVGLKFICYDVDAPVIWVIGIILKRCILLSDVKDASEQRSLDYCSKKQRRRMKRQKRKLETLNPWGYFTSAKIKHEESSSINQNAGNTNKNIVASVADEANADTKEQTMATVLWENAVRINSILEGNLADDVDYKLADLKNADAVQIDVTRRQGDKLIDCLGNISTTLNQLCDLVQKCN